MSRSTAADRDTDAGFTLIEALVALSVVAMALAAIGSVMATSVRGARGLGVTLTSVETARAVMSALPDRQALKPGRLAGEIAGQPWRLDVAPAVAPMIDPRIGGRWTPYTVAIRLQSPTGSVLQIDTVRLRRREGG